MFKPATFLTGLLLLACSAPPTAPAPVVALEVEASPTPSPGMTGLTGMKFVAFFKPALPAGALIYRLRARSLAGVGVQADYQALGDDRWSAEYVLEGKSWRAFPGSGLPVVRFELTGADAYQPGYELDLPRVKVDSDVAAQKAGAMPGSGMRLVSGRELGKPSIYWATDNPPRYVDAATGELL